MWSLSSKESSMTPPAHLPILCLRTMVPEIINISEDGKFLLKINLELQWLLWGMFQLDKSIYLRSTLKSKGSQIRQTEWDTYFNWHAEASLKFQNSFMERFVVKG